jgi:hypothetical protein
LLVNKPQQISAINVATSRKTACRGTFSRQTRNPDGMMNGGPGPGRGKGCAFPIVRLVILLALVLPACGVPLASERLDQAAKRFKYPSYDRAHIYVYRDESTCCIPSGKVALLLDGAPAVHLSDWTFALLPVRPGVHALTALGTDPSELRLNVIGGQVVYVRLHVDAGRFGIFIVWVAPDLQRMDRDEGREGVMDCRLIAQPPPALPRAGAAEPQ